MFRQVANFSWLPKSEKMNAKMKIVGNRYCAFLRGVNVKGTTMKMAEVCTVFENAGMISVSSMKLSCADELREAVMHKIETAAESSRRRPGARII